MYWLFCLFIGCFTMGWGESFSTSSLDQFPTYFQYTDQELEPFTHLNSSHMLSTKELIERDLTIHFWIKQSNQKEDSARIYAYVCVAQQDFALLSYRLKKSLAGSFVPVTSQTLALFSKELPISDQLQDEYSQALAAVIMTKVRERLKQDLAGMHNYPFIENNPYWKQGQIPVGLNVGTWKPWILTSGQSLRTPPPPPARDPFWQQQLQLVRETCMNRTGKQAKTAQFWAAMKLKKAPYKSDWRYIATHYMDEQNIPLPLFVVVRALLSMGLEDAWIAAFDSKYTYWVKRPDMLDPSLKTLGNVPNYPSYPAAHSALSATAATILSYFFPQSNPLWLDLAHESSVSRLWCGMHFPIDHQVGITLGERVGKATIQAFENAQAKEPALLY
jgi:membrane-associated phospholipid phosphatase